MSAVAHATLTPMLRAAAALGTVPWVHHRLVEIATGILSQTTNLHNQGLWDVGNGRNSLMGVPKKFVMKKRYRYSKKTVF